MGTLPEQTGASLATLQRLQMEQQAVASSLQAALDRMHALELTPELTPAGGPVMASELDQLRGELRSLRQRYTDEHPDVQALLVRIERLVQQPSAPVSASSTGGVLAAQLTEARKDVERLKARSQSVDQRIDRMQRRVDLAPRTEQQLATLTRDYQKLNENYMTLLNKKLDAQMAERARDRWKGERFRILDPAYLPEQPISPDRGFFAVLGVFLGLVAGLGLACGIEFLDPTVKDAEELASLQAYPILACIPRIPNLE